MTQASSSRGAGTSSQSSPRPYPGTLSPNLYHSTVQSQATYGNMSFPQHRMTPVPNPYYAYPAQFHVAGPHPMSPVYYPHPPPLSYPYPPPYTPYYPPRPPYESTRGTDYPRSNGPPYRGPKHGNRQGSNPAFPHSPSHSHKRSTSSITVPSSPFPMQTNSPQDTTPLGPTFIPPSSTPTPSEISSEPPSDQLPHQPTGQNNEDPTTPIKSTPVVGFLDEVASESDIVLPRQLMDATYMILPSRPDDPSIAHGLTFSSRAKPPPQVMKLAFMVESEDSEISPSAPAVPQEEQTEEGALSPLRTAAKDETVVVKLPSQPKLEPNPEAAVVILGTPESQNEVSEATSITPSRSSVYSSTAPTPTSHTPSPSSPISTATSISVHPGTAKTSPSSPLSAPSGPKVSTKSWADIAKKNQPVKSVVVPPISTPVETSSTGTLEASRERIDTEKENATPVCATSSPLASTVASLSQPEHPQKTLPPLHTVLTVSPSLSIPAPLTHPRGLINAGNMCFANVVLQALLHTAPFYKLFDMLGRTLPADLRRRALIDATIGFLREFQLETNSSPLERPPTPGKSNPVTAEQLRQLSWQQDSFVPQVLYDAISENKRFDSMRGGRQEDAEEFLGFLLDTLHEEFLTTLNRLQANPPPSSLAWATSKVSHGSSNAEEREVQRPLSPSNDDDGWMEVGKKNKVIQTRTTKARESAITRIFGGKLRSVLHTPGIGKDSVTLEPYQPLQLDIERDDVQGIEDALRHLTKPETVQVVSRGRTVDATKQVFIESLPPILIIHLKRFIYDGYDVQKSNKVLLYQTSLEIPNDVLAPAQRSPRPVRYRLYGVVYHHGKYASGGHYTLDILRQDSSKWLRIDDTQIETITESEVATLTPDKDLDKDKSAYILFYQRVSDEYRNVPVMTPRGQPRSRQHMHLLKPVQPGNAR